MSEKENYNKHYKYLVINEIDGNVQLLSNMKDVVDYLNEYYSEEGKKTSSSTLCRRLKEETHFKFYDILIKELTW